jgi:hypothetical protein
MSAFLVDSRFARPSGRAKTMPIWRTGAPPPSPLRAANGGGKRPTAGCSKSHRRSAQTTIFAAPAPHRLPSRARAASAHREPAPGFALAHQELAPGPWTAAQAGRRAGLCRRTNRFSVACRGEKLLVNTRPPARIREFRAEFRELLSDWAWTPPADFPLVSKKPRQPRAFQDDVQRGA